MTATVATVSLRERIIHAGLFEVIGILIMIPVNMLFLNTSGGSATWITIVIATAAMTWCFIHNKMFDSYYGSENKLNRSRKVRIIHAATFEIGFFAFSYPFLLSVTDLTILDIMYRTAFISTFYMFYTVIYNYCFDVIRSKIKN